MSSRFLAVFLGWVYICSSHQEIWANEPVFTAYSTPIPSQSLGGFSTYQNITPTVESPSAGNIVKVRLPLEGVKSASLQWWYADHIRPQLKAWPVGENGRIKLVLQSAEAVRLDIGVSLETGKSWVDGAPISGVDLPAGKETTVFLFLPKEAAQVGKIRILFSSAGAIPPLDISGLSVGSLTDAALVLPEEKIWRTVNPVPVSGRASGETGKMVIVRIPGEKAVPIAEWTAPLQADGTFSFLVDRNKLPAGREFNLVPSAPGKSQSPGNYTFFVYPVLDPAKTIPRIGKKGRDLVLNGKPFSFLGCNYTPFLLGLSRNADYRLVARNFRELHDWGFSAIRMPLPMAMIQPAPGIFPDHPEYRNTLKKAGVDPEFFELLQYAIALCRYYEIRVVFDWHEAMTDPYRYFIGGNPADAGSGKPGSPLAWLAMSKEELSREARASFLLDNPRHVTALFDTTTWLARAFKGEGAVLGYEVPYNEPHERLTSNEKNWRWLTGQAALRVKQADPEALTFGMPSGWGHENLFISSTWLLPDTLDGMTPHFYLSNGPIPQRPDAKERKFPHLAREVEPSLSLGLAAIALPYSACDYPIYNGEGGAHGAESFLPEMPTKDAARIMIEAQIVQAYASGMGGYMEWTMWNNDFWKEHHLPNGDLFQRYAPLMKSGPVDCRKSKVLFVQNPAAVPTGNGHNYACLPFARLVLDLHLPPVHYMTDEQLIFTGQVMFSSGFEQVNSKTEGLEGYKAIIVDTRNVDERAMEMLRKSGMPLLEITAEKPIDTKICAEFLGKNGIAVDQKTPVEFQLIRGPEHLLVYRRAEGNADKVYPILDLPGNFKLVSEDGSIAFTGSSEKLAAEGLTVKVAKWSAQIYRILRG